MNLTMTLPKFTTCQRFINLSKTHGSVYPLISSFVNSSITSKVQYSRLVTMPNNTIRPLVLCGPSGSGKSSILQRLLKLYPNKFGFSVSHTTRKPRAGEENGVHYHFTDKETMQNAIDSGEFIENAIYSGNLYGTSKSSVRHVLNAGKVCILDIEIQGAQQVKETDLNPLMIFVQPPSLEELEKRLRARNTETEESLSKRLDTAKIEMEYGLTPNNFHRIIVNDNLDRAYSEFEEYIFENFKFPEENSQ